jgi:hypothetical protein
MSVQILDFQEFRDGVCFEVSRQDGRWLLEQATEFGYAASLQDYETEADTRFLEIRARTPDTMEGQRKEVLDFVRGLGVAWLNKRSASAGG